MSEELRNIPGCSGHYTGTEATHMMATTVVLSGRSDLRKHIGQKVTVTGALSKGSPSSGRDDLNTLAVKSLKVIAKACSQEAQ